MSLLAEVIDRLDSQFYLTPVMAAELECYVTLADESTEVVESFWGQVDKAFRHEGLLVLRIEKERGWNQYEIVTGVTTAYGLMHTLNSIRETLEKYARRNSVEVYFDGKPYADQPSSGLHLHLHLADVEGLNAYHKTPEWMSEALRHSLGGLMATMHTSMPIFFPNPSDFARLEDVDHVPKIFGWGMNNRYCALRIPSNADFYNRRIEHRVPCANADPEKAIEAMLYGVLKGMVERIEPPEQQYGKTGIGLLESYAAASAAAARPSLGIAPATIADNLIAEVAAQALASDTLVLEQEVA